MKIAEVGNVVEFKDGLQGLVEKVNENSVIVNLTIMETVVNHKRYKILQSKDA